MKHINIMVVFIFLLTFNIKAQTGKVYPKTNIKKGVLKNGLTYYIYNNPSSKGKISYYLIQNVGAILEDDNQNGLSHFLEHMCFNGTNNFPGKSIIEMFEEKNLMRCLNAQTGIDKTVYHFIDVPTKYTALCDNCFLVLYDWCCGVTFPQKKINTERLVILEEKRTRNTPEWRLHRQNIEATLCNSKYTERDIIGTEQVIKNSNHNDFVTYYNKWYRPDLQSIVIIGDVDVYKTEMKIKNLFSTLEKKINPAKRYHITVPDNKETIYKQIVDSEIMEKEIRIKFRHNLKFDSDFKNMRLIIDNIIQKRIKKILKEKSQDYIKYLKISSNNIAQDYFNFGIKLGYKKNKAREALATTFSIYKDILKNGFTKEEFDKIKEDIIKYYTQYSNSYSSLPNNLHIVNIENNFINNEDIIDYKSKLKQFKKFIKKIKLDDVRKEINKLYSGPNKSIVVIDKDTNDILSKNEILEIEKDTNSKKYNADENKEDSKFSKIDSILTNDIKFSEIVKKEKLKIENASMWTLKNGAKIIYKECNYNGNGIFIHGYSPGGNSLLSNSDLYNAYFFKSVFSSLGIEGIEKKDLESYLSKNKIKYNLRINEDSESISMQSNYKNIEKSFKVLYNLFENPVFYEKKYNEVIDKIKEKFKNSIGTYEARLQDTLASLRYGNRHMSLDSNLFKNISIQEMNKVYRNRFSNASDFTFYIVGGVGEAKAKKLVEKYIGSISSIKKQESYKEIKHQFPTGETNIALKYDMGTPKSGVFHILNSHKDLSDKEKMCFKFLNIYLKDKLTKVIRHLENGTYNVVTNFYSGSKSLNNYGFYIQFDCDPARAKQLNNMLKLTLTTIAERGMQQIDLDLLKKPYEKEKPDPNAKRLKDIRYYLFALKAHIEEDKDITDINYQRNIFDSIDLKYINQILKDFLQKSDLLNVTYYPEP